MPVKCHRFQRAQDQEVIHINTPFPEYIKGDRNDVILYNPLARGWEFSVPGIGWDKGDELVPVSTARPREYQFHCFPASTMGMDVCPEGLWERPVKLKGRAELRGPGLMQVMTAKYGILF